MDEDNTMEQAIRRLLYSMLEDTVEHRRGAALRLIAAVVEAHEAEMDRAQGEIEELQAAREEASAHVQAARAELAEHRRHVSTIMSREAALKREVKAAPWLTPRQPVDVEALAGVMYEKYHGNLRWVYSSQQPLWKNTARAAIARLGLTELNNPGDTQ